MAWILTCNQRDGPREPKRGKGGEGSREGWEKREAGRGRGGRRGSRERGGMWGESREGGQYVCLQGTLAQE